MDTARNVDFIVITVGDEISQVGEQKDRADLTLSGRQLELFDRLKVNYFDRTEYFDFIVY